MKVSRKNSWTNLEDALFYYWIDFAFTKKEMLKFLISFSKDFFDLSDRYDILSKNQLQNSPVYQSYSDNYSDYIDYYFKANKIFLPLCIQEVRNIFRYEIVQPVSKISYYDGNGNILEEKVRKIWNIDHKAHVINSENISIFQSKNVLKYPIHSTPLILVSNFIDLSEFKPDDVIKWSFGIKTYNDIWLDTVSNYRFPIGDPKFDNWEYREIDNRPLAYRHTPRLNSFLRNLKELVVRYGGKWDFDYKTEGSWLQKEKYAHLLQSREVKEYCGIPLDGKLIYQEDIDVGKVKIPSM